MSEVHRFVPRRDAARTEFLAGAAAAFVVAAGWLSIGRGERSPALIPGLSGGAAALVLLSWFVRTRFQWVDEVRLSARIRGLLPALRAAAQSAPEPAAR